MTQEKLKEFVQAYQAGKILWTELGKALNEAYEQDASLLKGLGVNKRTWEKLIRSYRFLRLRCPEQLESKNPASYIKVSYLPLLLKRMPDTPDKPEKFKDLIKRVISGDLSQEDLIKLSQAFLRKEGPVRLSEVKKSVVRRTRSNGSNEAIDALGGSLSGLQYLLDAVLKKVSHDELRPILGEQCQRLSEQLNCIADEEYHRLWKDRKEFVL